MAIEMCTQMLASASSDLLSEVTSSVCVCVNSTMSTQVFHANLQKMSRIPSESMSSQDRLGKH
eukprot:5224293-Amphidinium_carterae.1